MERLPADSEPHSAHPEPRAVVPASHGVQPDESNRVLHTPVADETLRRVVFDGKMPCDADIYEALKLHSGSIDLIAEQFDVPRNRIARRVEEIPELFQLYTDFSETLVDIAERQLYTSVAAGDGPSVRFALNTKGANRGWTTKSEQKQGGEFTVNIRRIADADDA